VIAVTGYDNWVGLSLAVLGVLYLVMVLIFPERF
jgi:K+-transporting ATPase KdpF subunit